MRFNPARATSPSGSRWTKVETSCRKWRSRDGSQPGFALCVFRRKLANRNSPASARPKRSGFASRSRDELSRNACVRACVHAWSGRQALRECRLASNLSKGYKYASRGKPRRGNHIRARIERPPRLAGQYLGMLGKLSYLWTVRRVQIVRARPFGDGHLFFKRSNERAARQSPT